MMCLLATKIDVIKGCQSLNKATNEFKKWSLFWIVRPSKSNRHFFLLNSGIKVIKLTTHGQMSKQYEAKITLKGPFHCP